MKYALNLAEDGRILSATYEQFAPEVAVLVDELPNGDISDYLCQDGEYVYDPLPESEPAPEPEVPVDPVTQVYNELDAAYTAGYNEGYQEGVNTAYDNQ